LNFQLTRGYFRFVGHKKELRGGMMDWKRLLAYITGSMDQELLLRNEYLAAENRILRNQLKGRWRAEQLSRDRQKARQEGTRQ
jgi:hypothetical protein